MSGDLTFNKYAAAILATALGFMILKEVSHGAMHVEKQEKFAYCAECVTIEPADTGKAEPLPFPQTDWVESMDAEKGEKYFKACQTCHTVDKGGKALQGPNLWDIVGRTSGSNAGYSYSDGMANLGVDWGYEELDTFLKRPSKYVKGTKMGYSGEKKGPRRAAIIEYLRTLSDNPLPRPEAVAAEAPTEDMVEDISAPNLDEPKVIDAPKKMDAPQTPAEPNKTETIKTEPMKDVIAAPVIKEVIAEPTIKEVIAEPVTIEKAAESVDIQAPEIVTDVATDVVPDIAQTSPQSTMETVADTAVNNATETVKDMAAEKVDEMVDVPAVDGNDLVDKAEELVTSDE